MIDLQEDDLSTCRLSLDYQHAYFIIPKKEHRGFFGFLY